MGLTAGVRAGRAARIQFFASAWTLMARSHPRIALGRGARNAHAPGGILDADDVVYEDSLLRIARIQGRGHGVTAVRGFATGDVVLEEAPFVRVPTWLPPAEGLESHPYSIHYLVIFLLLPFQRGVTRTSDTSLHARQAQLVFDQLTPALQDQWMALCQVRSLNNNTSKKTPGSVLLSNAFTKNGHCLMYPRACRLNHSCMPNTRIELIGTVAASSNMTRMHARMMARSTRDLSNIVCR